MKWRTPPIDLHAMGSRLLALCCCFGLGGISSNADQTAAAGETFIYWAADHPVFFELVVETGHQDHQRLWDEASRALFDSFDSNRDGLVTGTEGVADLLEIAALELVSSGDIGSSVPPTPARMDYPAFARRLQSRGLLPVCVGTVAPKDTPRRSAGQQLDTDPKAIPIVLVNQHRLVSNQHILAAFDRDGDGKLSHSELAEPPLHLLDLDDDEQISAQEILLTQRQPDSLAEGRRAAARQAPPRDDHQSVPPHLTLLSRASSKRGIVRELLNRYDRDRDGLLSGGELGVATDVLQRFDQDRNNGLDSDELQQLLSKPPLATSVVCPWSRTPPAAGTNPTAIAVDTLPFRLGWTSPSWPVGRSYWDSLVQRYDANKNQYLEPDEAEASRLLGSRFHLIDRDRDNRLFAAEVADYADRVAPLAALQIVLQPELEPADLFEAIDQDRDGKLSRLELLNAYRTKRLSAVSRPEHDRPTATWMAKPQESWLLRATGSTGASPTIAAPAWFLNMDVNRDGVISLREFLPSHELFHSLDVNGDGLLEPHEIESLTPQ